MSITTSKIADLVCHDSGHGFAYELPPGLVQDAVKELQQLGLLVELGIPMTACQKLTYYVLIDSNGGQLPEVTA